MIGATYRYCPSCATPFIEKQVGHTIRPVCPACGFIVFLEPKLVTVVVVQYNGKILLGKRNIDPGMGLWSFAGGYVDRGEQLEAAALREVKEETNLDVRLDGLIGLYSEAGRPHILVAYRASVHNNDISALAAQPEEVSELAFFSPQEVPDLAFPSTRRILQDWLGEM